MKTRMSSKKISVTHFELDLNDKIGGSEGQPNVFVGVLRRLEVRGLPGGIKDSATHHIRVGAKVPPPAKAG